MKLFAEESAPRHMHVPRTVSFFPNDCHVFIDLQGDLCYIYLATGMRFFFFA